MIYRFSTGLAFLFTTFLISVSAFSQGYSIKVKMNDYSGNNLFLAYHVGAKSYIADTATKDNEGYFVFKGEEPKHPGMYMIVTEPDNNLFEFLIPNKKEQRLSFTATYGKSIEWSVSGSPENEQFKKYLQVLETKRSEITTLKEKEATDEAAKKKMKAEIAAIDKTVNDYQDNYIKKHPGTLMANIIKAGIAPVIPEKVKQQPNNAALYYYRSHLFDNIALNDNRLLYTPLIINAVESYLENLTVQDPDSVIKSVDVIMDKIKKGGDKEVYQFVLIHLLNKYAKTTLVCMDKAYVHIGTTYYCGSNTPFWIEKEQLEKICANVENMRYSQCGMVAPPINLSDAVTSKAIKLAAINSPYTVVFFWQPNAKRSDDEVEALKTIYQKWNSKGLSIIGVANRDKSGMVAGQSIPWPYASGLSKDIEEVKNKYDVIIYPQIYLLDEHKKIISKRIKVKQLDEILAKLIK